MRFLGKILILSVLLVGLVATEASAETVLDTPTLNPTSGGTTADVNPRPTHHHQHPIRPSGRAPSSPHHPNPRPGSTMNERWPARNRAGAQICPTTQMMPSTRRQPR